MQRQYTHKTNKQCLKLYNIKINSGPELFNTLFRFGIK